MRQAGAQTSLPNNYSREDQYGRNPNLRGENGEPSEILSTTDARSGKPVTIEHHRNGHRYTDDGTHELPH
jgi:hypothetical protein